MTTELPQYPLHVRVVPEQSSIVGSRYIEEAVYFGRSQRSYYNSCYVEKS